MGGPDSGRRAYSARRRQAERLRARGLSLPEIGRRLGVSHQAVGGMLRGSDIALPPVLCCACAGDVVVRSDSRDRGRVYCRACLSARSDVPLGDRLRSLRVAEGLTQQALAERTGLSRSGVAHAEQGAHDRLSWRIVRALVDALGVELVPGARLHFAPCRVDTPGSVRCHECGRAIAPPPGCGRPNRGTLCLACLARHPEAGFGERLRAHRLAAGLTLEALGALVGSAGKSLSAYERGGAAPRWEALAKLVGVLGLGLVGDG
jgi:HTH-type transcriptional regulator/antitoxin HipB